MVDTKTASEVRSRRRLDAGERRHEILRAAHQLFSERPYSAVSSEDIAEAAGVRRGLLHHYFGTKRDLYLAVARDLVGRAAMPFDGGADRTGTIDEVVAANVGRFLDLVERDKAMWLAAASTDGFGRDEDMEKLVSAARDATVQRIVDVLQLDDSEILRAVLRSYAGLVSVALNEWLRRGALNRAQTEAMLAAALVAMVREVAPAAERADISTTKTGGHHGHLPRP